MTDPQANRFKIIKVLLHPPEAEALAKEFRSCANQIEAYYQEVNRLLQDLDATWRGNQKDVFIKGFLEIPPRLKQQIEMLNNYAVYFQNLQITKEERISIP